MKSRWTTCALVAATSSVINLIYSLLKYSMGAAATNSQPDLLVSQNSVDMSRRQNEVKVLETARSHLNVRQQSNHLKPPSSAPLKSLRTRKEATLQKTDSSPSILERETSCAMCKENTAGNDLVKLNCCPDLQMHQDCLDKVLYDISENGHRYTCPYCHSWR